MGGLVADRFDEFGVVAQRFDIGDDHHVREHSGRVMFSAVEITATDVDEGIGTALRFAARVAGALVVAAFRW